MSNRADDLVTAALRAVEQEAASPAEKAEMLMELAAGLQSKPRSPADIPAAIHLYRTALPLCGQQDALLAARLRARLATALIALSGDSLEPLQEARDQLEAALPGLAASSLPAETAEAEMNLGLTLQTLASLGAGRIQDAIAAYQRALRVFDRAAHPQEFAILQNNLATAFLSIPFTDERSKLREALAVQAFEEGLAVVTLIDHPREWAMLQNNLGNALQHATTSHPIENRLRALDAYDEALKVRSARTTPSEYANTIANKASCLANLPDDLEHPDRGNPHNTVLAIGLYGEAATLFGRLGETDKQASVAAIMADIAAEAA